MKALRYLFIVALALATSGCKVASDLVDEDVRPLKSHELKTVQKTTASMMSSLNVAERAAYNSRRSHPLAVAPVPERPTQPKSDEELALEEVLEKSRCHASWNQPDGGVWDLDQNGRFLVSVNGGVACPVNFKKEHRLRLHSFHPNPAGYVNLELSYNATNYKYRYLNDVSQVFYKGTIDIKQGQEGGTRYNTKIEGYMLSQQHGRISIGIYEDLVEGVSSLDGETTYRLHFKKFSVEGREIYKTRFGRVKSEYFINGDEVTQAEFRQTFVFDFK